MSFVFTAAAVEIEIDLILGIAWSVYEICTTSEQMYT